MFGRIDAKTQHPAVSRKLVSPAGDLAAKRDAEVSKAFPRNFKRQGSIPSNPLASGSKSRLMNDGGSGAGAWPKGPDTVGGVVGGKSDKESYQGKKAGRG
jgi:hypothetical protein